MYFVSFIKSIFKPSNLLSTLYFLANVAIIYLLFGVFSFFSFDTPYDFHFNGLIGLGINFVIMLFALSPIGEALMRRQEKAVLLTKCEETQPIYDVFNETYEAAIRQYPKLSKKIKLYYINTNIMNAYAIGHRTLIITDGLLSLSKEELQGVLAHEFGHIAHNDSDMKLAVYVTNCVLLVVITVLNLVFRLVAGLFGIISNKLAFIIQNLITIILSITFGLWTKLGMLLLNATSRSCEYKADAFAVGCGKLYGQGLRDALCNMDPSATKMKFTSLLASTHPSTPSRIEKIDQAINTLYNAE